MKATLKIHSPMTDLTQYIVDCEHGTTIVSQGGMKGTPDKLFILIAIGRHIDEEGCQCCDGMLARYGGAEAN